VEPKRYVWHANGQEVFNKIHRAWEAATNPAMPGTLPKELSSRQRISVDVFDTLLLRKPLSERRRLFKIATVFSNRVPNLYKRPSPELVYWARVEAQRWAYRALDAIDQDGEVKIFDIFKRQVQLLGLPTELASLLLDAELQVERGVLVPNRPLVRWLKLQRSRYIPVIAISDTSLPATAIESLIEAIAGPNVIDRVYTSADLGLSKRNGGIFTEVATREKTDVRELIHFGDDRRADVQQGLAAGIQSTHLRRSPLFVIFRKLDGLLFEAGRFPGRYLAQRKQARPIFYGSGNAFGHTVLGPIIVRYCLRLWLYLSYADQPGGNCTALFCARGGLNLRVVFEALLERLQLPLEMPRADLMISRLVAVRAALLLKSPSAFEEIGREFGRSTIAVVARALAQSEIEFGSEWEIPFDPEVFFRLMNTTEEGAKLEQRLTDQNSLFESYLQNLTQGKKRLVLCDTGLYGSTVRLLQAGFPTRRWECLLFARCNYKGFVSEHFAKTVGLLVERNCYDPFDTPSTVLRHWLFVERLFEPDLESVRTFAQADDGSIASNLEAADWRERFAASRSPLLNGVLSYIGELPRNGWFERLSLDEPVGWLILKKAILFPTRFDLQILSVGERSQDFGRAGTIKAFSSERASSLSRRLALFRTARWKEGLAAQEFPATRLFIQAALESAYAMKWFLRRMKPRSLRGFL
jgi:FMN phosphatase YigB (HAD superfamily)